MFVGNTIAKKILSSALALLLNISGVSPLSLSSESAFHLKDDTVYRLENDDENEGSETVGNGQDPDTNETPGGSGSNNDTTGNDNTTNDDQNDPPAADPQNNGDDQEDDDPGETYVYSFLSMDPVSIAEVVVAAGVVPAEDAEAFVSGITAVTVDTPEDVAVTQDETSYFITQI